MRCYFKSKDPPTAAERLGAVRDEVVYEDDIFNDRTIPGAIALMAIPQAAEEINSSHQENGKKLKGFSM